MVTFFVMVDLGALMFTSRALAVTTIFLVLVAASYAFDTISSPHYIDAGYYS
jgi:hypothetical protein